MEKKFKVSQSNEVETNVFGTGITLQYYIIKLSQKLYFETSQYKNYVKIISKSTSDQLNNIVEALNEVCGSDLTVKDLEDLKKNQQIKPFKPEIENTHVEAPQKIVQSEPKTVNENSNTISQQKSNEQPKVPVIERRPPPPTVITKKQQHTTVSASTQQSNEIESNPIAFKTQTETVNNPKPQLDTIKDNSKPENLPIKANDQEAILQINNAEAQKIEEKPHNSEKSSQKEISSKIEEQHKKDEAIKAEETSQKEEVSKVEEQTTKEEVSKAEEQIEKEEVSKAEEQSQSNEEYSQNEQTLTEIEILREEKNDEENLVEGQQEVQNIKVEEQNIKEKSTSGQEEQQEKSKKKENTYTPPDDYTTISDEQKFKIYKTEEEIFIPEDYQLKCDNDEIQVFADECFIDEEKFFVKELIRKYQPNLQETELDALVNSVNRVQFL